jgi:ribonuclease P protein component
MESFPGYNCFMFPIYNRKITTSAQYKFVYNGHKIYTNHFNIFFRFNNQNYNYFGISISKKVGNSVVRHRLKRWILENLKIHGIQYPSSYNVVFMAKNHSQEKNFETIANDIKNGAATIKKILMKNNEK